MLPIIGGLSLMMLGAVIIVGAATAAGYDTSGGAKLFMLLFGALWIWVGATLISSRVKSEGKREALGRNRAQRSEASVLDQARRVEPAEPESSNDVSRASKPMQVKEGCKPRQRKRRRMSLKGAKNLYKKSEAAALVESLLRTHINELGLFNLPAPPNELANRLVGDVWETMPDIFSGEFGQRPHRFTVAAHALVRGAKRAAHGDDTRLLLEQCLMAVINELRINGALYPLNSLDMWLLQKLEDETADLVMQSGGQEPNTEPPF